MLYSNIVYINQMTNLYNPELDYFFCVTKVMYHSSWKKYLYFYPTLYVCLSYVFIFMSLLSAACLNYERGNVEIIVCSLLKCLLNALQVGCVLWACVYCVRVAFCVHLRVLILSGMNKKWKHVSFIYSPTFADPL